MTRRASSGQVRAEFAALLVSAVSAVVVAGWAVVQGAVAASVWSGGPARCGDACELGFGLALATVVDAVAVLVLVGALVAMLRVRSWWVATVVSATTHLVLLGSVGAVAALLPDGGDDLGSRAARTTLQILVIDGLVVGAALGYAAWHRRDRRRALARGQ